MEQLRYLIDTNSVIDYLGNKLPLIGMEFMNSIIDTAVNVSVITKIEVLGFNATKEHYELLTDFMSDATIFDLTDNVVEACIDIRKKNRTKLPDAIIAATALFHNLVLITRNTSDFKDIEGLQVINPHLLER